MKSGTRVHLLVLWVLVAIAVVGFFIVGRVQTHNIAGFPEFTVSSEGTFINLEDYLQAARRYYLMSNEADRLVIRTVVLREVAGWDLNVVKDPSLTAWVIDLQREEKR